jgi:hypothetical protein
LAKRLDWEKEAKRLKVNREGAGFGYDELPAVGSPADKVRYLDEKGYKQAKQLAAGTVRFKKTKQSSANEDNSGAIRQALEMIQRELLAVFDRENSRLMASDVWQKLSSRQKRYLRQRFGLQKPVLMKISTKEDLDSTLRESSLAKRRSLVAAMPRHFQSALEEATRQLELDGRIVRGRR